MLSSLIGCAPKPTQTPVAPEPPDRCRLSRDSTSRDTVTVALGDTVDPAHASNPTNDSERLLFRQLFETLIRLDCEGVVRPAAAVAWRSDSSHRVWTFTLDRNPGSSSSYQIVSDWQSRKETLESIGIDSVVALDDRTVAATLRIPDSVPRLFADPSLAHGDDGSLGSPWYSIDSRAGNPPILFWTAPADLRDALDRGVDLVVTRDPALIDYVAGRPEFVSFPLPWTRTYLLVQPATAQPIAASIASDSARRSLARDAVRAEARRAEPPFWWDDLASCPASVDSNGPRPASSRVVYQAGDEVARGLAERVVALAGNDARLRAAPLSRSELTDALRGGTEQAYVIAIPRQTLAPCRDSAEWPPAASLRPLIDTRARAILRRGAAELTVDWDGTVRVEEDQSPAESP